MDTRIWSSRTNGIARSRGQESREMASVHERERKAKAEMIDEISALLDEVVGYCGESDWLGEFQERLLGLRGHYED